MEKNTEKNDPLNEQCLCKKTQGLFIENKQLSFTLVSVLLLFFCLFMGGYFLGQKNATVLFSNHIEQESFGDHIYSSMCAMNDSGEVEENDSESVDERQPQEATEIKAQDSAINPEQSIHKESDDISNNDETLNKTIDVENTTETDQEISTQYYAQLVGFGTARAAQLFVKKLNRKEISAMVKKRQSRTAKGKFVSWYQVITEKYDDKASLLDLVDKLKKEEKLSDIKIVTC